MTNASDGKDGVGMRQKELCEYCRRLVNDACLTQSEVISCRKRGSEIPANVIKLEPKP